LTALLTIHAHDSQLAAIRFSADAKKLATASTKGTVIRVFAIPTGERLFEFTRGLKRCVAIHSLAFSKDSLYLCSTSNTETVHVYKLEKSDNQSQQRCVRFGGWDIQFTFIFSVFFRRISQNFWLNFAKPVSSECMSSQTVNDSYEEG
uniref:WD repeat domain phosphoinositide-interacting protein 1 (inferred by orthology to a human protein) n=1 Tax=Anisakis simplex TaxID=6269 RepID=A0A0M3JDC3_ANISI